MFLSFSPPSALLEDSLCKSKQQIYHPLALSSSSLLCSTMQSDPWLTLWSRLSNTSSRLPTRHNSNHLAPLLLRLIIFFPLRPPSQAFRRTSPLKLGDAVEEHGPHAAGSTAEILEAQAAELSAIYVKVLEGNGGGVELVHVHHLLQPFPHLVLAPELRQGVLRPQATCVTRHHHWKRGQTLVISTVWKQFW